MKAIPFLIRSFLLLTILAFLAACAENPADGVDQAEVSDPETTPVPPPPASTPATRETYVFTDESKIEFVGSKVTGSHSGGFANFVGKFETSGDQLAPRGMHAVTIDMASTYSDNEKLTEHLKGADFFDVAQFPTSRFDLKKAEPKGEDKYELTGTLELRGEVKSITFPATVKVSETGKLIDMQAEFSINRKDFGIVYAGKADDLIRDEVVLKFDVAAAPGEPQPLDLSDDKMKAALSETRDERGKGGKSGKKGGKGPSGIDWRNMSEEERAKARQEWVASMDTNGDRNLSKEEVPERAWTFMSEHMDKDKDGLITEKERHAFRAEREAERMAAELSGEEPRRLHPGGKGGKGSGGKGTPPRD